MRIEDLRKTYATWKQKYVEPYTSSVLQRAKQHTSWMLFPGTTRSTASSSRRVSWKEQRRGVRNGERLESENVDNAQVMWTEEVDKYTSYEGNEKVIVGTVIKKVGNNVVVVVDGDTSRSEITLPHPRVTTGLNLFKDKDEEDFKEQSKRMQKEFSASLARITQALKVELVGNAIRLFEGGQGGLEQVMRMLRKTWHDLQPHLVNSVIKSILFGIERMMLNMLIGVDADPGSSRRTRGCTRSGCSPRRGTRCCGR